MNGLHTHYDNLKVARNAPPEVIRAAYKSLCAKFHPDHHPDNPSVTQIFQLINAAYTVLSDPVQRKQHDQWIARAESRQAHNRTSAAAGTVNAPRTFQARRRGDRRRSKTVRMVPPWLDKLSPLRQPGMPMVFWIAVCMIGTLLALLFQG